MRLRYLLNICYSFLIITLLSGIFLVVGCEEPSPYNVQPDGYAIITAPLSLDEDEYGTFIPHGSVVIHWANGITEVYGPDNERLFIARDAEAGQPIAPGGPKPATHMLQVPSGAHVSDEGDNITKVYQGDTTILTIINKSEDF